MTEASKEDVQEAMAKQVQRSAQRIAELLRETAMDVDRHAARVRLNLHDMKPDHANVAEEVAHDISRLMGNLCLDSLIRIAAEADFYARSTDTDAADEQDNRETKPGVR